METAEEAVRRKIGEVAEFYDDPKKALELLVKSLARGKLQGKCIDLFLEKQREAFEKRQRSNTKHTLGILENELDESPSVPLFGGLSEQSASVTNIPYNGDYRS